MTNMDGNIFAIVCGSITFADFFFNVFFILCLVLTRREPGVNQQHLLRFLLSLVIFTSLFYQMNQFLTVVLEAFEKSAIRSLAMTYFAFLLFMANYSCSSWISVFYYFKIVQRNTAMFTWVKTNIDKVTYCGLVIDCTFLLSGWISAIFDKLSSLGLVYPDVSMVHHNSTLPQARHTAKSYLFFLSRILLVTYYVRPLSCMVWCSSRTYIYLQKHMKSIVDNSSSFSQPQLEAQMRVVVTCMVQAVIFLLGSVFSIVVISIYDHPEYLKRDPEGYSHSGIAIFIMFSNSLCLGFSQSVFRHRVIAFFKKVVKWIYIRR